MEGKWVEVSSVQRGGVGFGGLEPADVRAAGEDVEVFVLEGEVEGEGGDGGGEGGEEEGKESHCICGAGIVRGGYKCWID